MEALGRSIKTLTKAIYALASTALTAAGSGDATTVNGSAIDTTLYKAESIVFDIPCKAVLTAAMNLTVKLTVEHSSTSNSGFTAVVAEATALTLGDTVGGTMYGVARAGVDLNKCLRYVRVTALPDLSHTGTDTAVMGAGVATLGGLQELP
jgi:hypothetical protein